MSMCNADRGESADVNRGHEHTAQQLQLADQLPSARDTTLAVLENATNLQAYGAQGVETLSVRRPPSRWNK